MEDPAPADRGEDTRLPRDVASQPLAELVGRHGLQSAPPAARQLLPQSLLKEILQCDSPEFEVELIVLER